jgi:signal transduction histidine kinase
MQTGALRVSHLELRQLRYVLLVVEHRSVSAAAARLALPPRTLRRELERVERTLGTPLFQRLPRRTVPTAAGEEIAAIARGALAAQIAEQQELPDDSASLRVGWLDFGRGQALQRAALAEFRAGHPDVTVHLMPSLFRDQPHDLCDELLDVGFYTGPRPTVPGARVELLIPDTVGCAMLPAGHRLSGAERLSLTDLSGFPFHSLRMDFLPEVMAGLHDTVSRGGWRGRQTTGSTRPSEVITAVACGAGWAPAPSDLLGWAPPGVEVLPLADGPLVSVDLYVLWRDESPLARAFVRMIFELRDVIEASQAPPPAAGREPEAGYGALLAQRYAERARVARGLHDTLLQDVTGTELQLEGLRRRLPPGMERENRELEQVVARLGRAVRAGREVLQNLGPTGGRGRDLAAQLAEEADRRGRGSGAAFEIQTTGEPRDLRTSVADAALRVGAEAVGNAFRHAAASRVSVSLDYWDDLFRVRVEDDGLGIDPSILEAGGRNGHLGMRLMKERAAAVEGTLTVERGPAAGTVVEMVVPGHLAFSM